MNKKKVLLITTDIFPKFNGGPGSVLTNLINNWKYKEIELDIVSELPQNSFTEKQSFISKLINFLKLKIPNIMFPLTIYRRQKNLLKKLMLKDIKNYDVIHAHDVIAFKVIHDFLKYKEVSKPIILSIHTPGLTSNEFKMQFNLSDNNKYLKKFIKTFEVFSLEKADIIACPSNGVYELIINQLQSKNFKISPKQNIPLYNGIKNIILVQEYNCQSKYILAIGRLIKEKGFDILIKVYAEINKKHNLPFLYIAGMGPEYEKLKKLISNNKLQDKIKLLGYRKDIIDLLKNSRLYVSPNRVSAFDITILESLNCAIPVIASNVGGNREAINEKFQNGILYDFDEEGRGLKKALSSLVNDYEKLKIYSKNAKNIFIKHFDINNMLKRYKDLYETVF